MSDDVTNDEKVESSKSPEPYFEFEFPSPIGRQPFDDFEEVEEFVETIKRLWSWVAGDRAKAGWKADVGNRVHVAMDRFTNAIEHCREQPESDSVGTALDGAFQRAFNGPHSIFHPRAAQTKYIHGIKEALSDDIAMSAASWLMGFSENMDARASGIAFGVFYDEMSKKDGLFAPHGEAIEESRAIWEQKLVGLHKQYKGNEHDRKTSFDKMLADNTEDRETQQEHFDDLEGKYKAIQNVREPMEYWNTKRNWHLGIAAVTGIFALIAGGFGAWGLVEMSWLAQDKIAALKNVDGWSLLPHSFPTLVVGIAVYWVVRLLVKLCMTNVHLATDASERVVMVKTFISLLVDEKTTVVVREHGDLRVILEQLFRHQPVGLIRYDGGPANQTLVGRATGD